MRAAVFAKAPLAQFSIERHRRGLLAFSTSSIFVVAIVFTSSSFLISYLLFVVSLLDMSGCSPKLHSIFRFAMK